MKERKCPFRVKGQKYKTLFHCDKCGRKDLETDYCPNCKTSRQILDYHYDIIEDKFYNDCSLLFDAGCGGFREEKDTCYGENICPIANGCTKKSIIDFVLKIMR